MEAKTISYAREKGLSVRAWGIKDLGDMNAALSFDIESMTVNFPDKLAQALKDR